MLCVAAFTAEGAELDPGADDPGAQAVRQQAASQEQLLATAVKPGSCGGPWRGAGRCVVGSAHYSVVMMCCAVAVAVFSNSQPAKPTVRSKNQGYLPMNEFIIIDVIRASPMQVPVMNCLMSESNISSMVLQLHLIMNT
jgi:hypothetical protein